MMAVLLPWRSKQYHLWRFAAEVSQSYSTVPTTEYTEWQRLLSGAHSIMRVKLAQAGVGGGCTPTPFYYTYHQH
jgi:hypothetical protein